MRTLSCPVKLIIRAYHEGKVQQVEKESDLILDQFGKIWSKLIMEWRDAYNRNVNLKDTSGNTYTFRIIESGNYIFNRFNSGYGNYITVGTLDTAATRSDYALAGPLSSKKSNNASYSNGTITFAATFVWGEAKTIKECGVFWKMIDITPIARTVLMFRDTFSPVTGSTITVEYQITM